MPDIPGDKGCSLFDPTLDYPFDQSGPICADVCAAYEASKENNSSNLQVAYSCDATLCTAVGIGQEDNENFPPPHIDQAALLGEACDGIAQTKGLTEIALVEALSECSCCASQVCGCENINQETNSAIVNLNAEQTAAGIIPQCDINQTLCGSN